MNKTKKKIILAAIELFNEQGMVNVLNQNIAKAADTSLSNFNYHFKTKGDLIYAVCSYMRNILKERVVKIQVLTREGQGLELTKVYFEFARDFRFFYLDTHNILQTYPVLKKEMQRQINESIQIIKNLNYISVGMGHMEPEPANMPGLYDHLAHQIWMNSHFWMAQTNIRGLEESRVVEGLETIFAICYPFLTQTGIAAYRNFIARVQEEEEIISE